MQQPPSSSTVRIISLDREALLAQLRAIAAQIRRECDVEDVRIFGSLARGNATGTSDVDVLIIVRHSTEADMVRRILSFLPYFDLDRGTDLLVYTRAELEQQTCSAEPLPAPHLARESAALIPASRTRITRSAASE